MLIRLIHSFQAESIEQSFLLFLLNDKSRIFLKLSINEKRNVPEIT